VNVFIIAYMSLALVMFSQGPEKLCVCVCVFVCMDFRELVQVSVC